jgi:hypothetical protein
LIVYLNVKWATASQSKSKKTKAIVETVKSMDDEATLSSRPDFPPQRNSIMNKQISNLLEPVSVIEHAKIWYVILFYR